MHFTVNSLEKTELNKHQTIFIFLQKQLILKYDSYKQTLMFSLNSFI